MTTELDEARIDEIWESGADAAVGVWVHGPKPPCPHPEGSEEATIWWRGFDYQLFLENT